MTTVDLWPHQAQGLADVAAAIARGERRILLTSPTGGGKTRVMCELIVGWVRDGHQVVLYTNRRLLVEQTSRVLRENGIPHGVRAAGHEDQRGMAVQVSSIQTEHARVLKAKSWDLHDAHRVIVDEAHLNSAKTAKTLLDAHHAAGGAYVGFTATPLSLEELYDTLIVAGKPSSLRACGALVPCFHYGPDEPDLRKIGRVQLGQDLTEKQAVKAIMTPTIFARVLESFLSLNPEQKPTILFGPGVAESLWFAEQLCHPEKRATVVERALPAITAAHIDGTECWLDGKSYRTCQKIREEILGRSKDGSIRVLCNRFVLREGIDAPWLAHGIFATVFGSLQSYLQSGGRLLRSHPSIESVTLQDHGGNWWRHGSLNADRHWELCYTPLIVSGLWEENLRQNPPSEPVRCPRCGLILSRAVCKCGFEIDFTKKSRPVVQSDGSLKEHRGNIVNKHRITKMPNAEEIWRRMYFRAKNGNMTFRQAEALFSQENNFGWPGRDLPLMPRFRLDFFRKVKDVPTERLRT